MFWILCKQTAIAQF